MKWRFEGYNAGPQAASFREAAAQPAAAAQVPSRALASKVTEQGPSRWSAQNCRPAEGAPPSLRRASVNHASETKITEFHLDASRAICGSARRSALRFFHLRQGLSPSRSQVSRSTIKADSDLRPCLQPVDREEMVRDHPTGGPRTTAPGTCGRAGIPRRIIVILLPLRAYGDDGLSRRRVCVFDS